MNSVNDNAYYGPFGGQFVPELLMTPIQELEAAFRQFVTNETFKGELFRELISYAGRPTPLTLVENFSQAVDGPIIYLKREDLLHTGAHKLNNALGQCLLAKTMGKTRVIAETGAGQHGVATATACARLGLPCVVYMGAVDAKRQSPNVKRMKLLGAEVIEVQSGSKTLKDAVNEALRDWAANYDNTYYCLGSAVGPHPYPEMVKFFQQVIGIETQQQCKDRGIDHPDLLVACVGGGSNAIGLFAPFVENHDVQMVGVEAGGKGNNPGEHAARFNGGRIGVFQGFKSYVLQDDNGQILSTHSISAGLDYPMIGPVHAALKETGRATYTHISDEDAVKALKLLSKTEGIIPALESAHAIAYVMNIAHTLPKETVVVINCSGRGDKDLPQLFELEERAR